jgi:short-chain Z-isoprenyl diphosphate synthase
VRNLIYKLYEQRLERGLATEDLPNHVAVMLDGNRRWAELNRGEGAKASHGHVAGAQKIHEFLQWCDEIGIRTVTLYLLSIDNLTRRPGEELADLVGIIGGLATALSADGRYRLQVMGERDALPAQLRSELETAVIATGEVKVNDERGVHVNLAVGYGGRNEIADAMRSILKSHSSQGTSIDALAELLTPELIGEHLYTGGQPDPDLIIRTSGEQRLSGFLLWQSASSELYFEEALWPDFRKVDFLRAIRAFESRHRRFGA